MADLRKENPYPKPPQLKGLGAKLALRNLYGSLVIAAAATIWFKESVFEKDKAFFKEYFDNYDPEKEYQFIKSQGVFRGFEAD